MGPLFGPIHFRKPASYGDNIRVVSPYEYQTISAALADITDATTSNRYAVYVEPGNYAGFTMKSFVSIVGMGYRSAIISATNSVPVDCGCTSGTLANFTMDYTDSGGLTSDQGIIERTGSAERVEFHNLDMFVSSIGAASNMRWAFNFGAGDHDIQFNNINIETCCGGYKFPTGSYRLHDCNTVLIPGQTILPHICMQIENAARVDVMGGRWGTGYWVQDQDHGDDDGDTYCFYIPASNTGSNMRLWMDGVQAYARNVNATSGTNVNVIRAENGWVRVGPNCLLQAEGTGNGNYASVYSNFRTASQPVSGQGGRVEFVNHRPNAPQSGNVSGGRCINVQTFTSDATLDKFEAGVIECDSTSGSFTIYLPAFGTVPRGSEYTFKKISSTNTVTIDLASANLEGSGTNPTLTTLYDSLHIVAGSSEWLYRYT